jgi:uncharacterized GH25 family protein
MTHMTNTTLAAVVVVGMTVGVAGCGRSEPASQAPAASETSGAAPTVNGPLDITLKTDPDPVKTGDNALEAMVMQDGKPVTDATVSVEFYMPAMPAMKMAEMRTKTDLTNAGNGLYRGNGQVMMAGNWDVTVTATQGSGAVSTKKITMTAK